MLPVISKSFNCEECWFQSCMPAHKSHHDTNNKYSRVVQPTHDVKQTGMQTFRPAAASQQTISWKFQNPYDCFCWLICVRPWQLIIVSNKLIHGWRRRWWIWWRSEMILLYYTKWRENNANTMKPWWRRRRFIDDLFFKRWNYKYKHLKYKKWNMTTKKKRVTETNHDIDFDMNINHWRAQIKNFRVGHVCIMKNWMNADWIGCVKSAMFGIIYIGWQSISGFQCVWIFFTVRVLCGYVGRCSFGAFVTKLTNALFDRPHSRKPPEEKIKPFPMAQKIGNGCQHAIETWNGNWNK